MLTTHRRIVEVFTGEATNKFFTIRLDVDLNLTNEQIIAEWTDILEALRLRYETQVRFVPPQVPETFPGYMPALPGETGWDWAGEEDVELF